MKVSHVGLIGAGIFALSAVGFAFADYPLLVVAAFVASIVCVASAESHATDYVEED